MNKEQFEQQLLLWQRKVNIGQYVDPWTFMGITESQYYELLREYNSKDKEDEEWRWDTSPLEVAVVAVVVLVVFIGVTVL